MVKQIKICLVVEHRKNEKVDILLLIYNSSEKYLFSISEVCNNNNTYFYAIHDKHVNDHPSLILFLSIF